MAAVLSDWSTFRKDPLDLREELDESLAGPDAVAILTELDRIVMLADVAGDGGFQVGDRTNEGLRIIAGFDGGR